MHAALSVPSLSFALLQASASPWVSAPALPVSVTNNAVAAAVTSTGPAVFSFLGLDSTRQWSGVRSWAFRWNVGDTAWSQLPGVPGPGRLAATAQALRGRIYLFGGYTVAADGSERSLPDVAVYDPDGNTWSVGAPIPVPVDDAVSGVWRDSLIYLVSGWHDRDNVSDVQIYDPARDSWKLATPIPGAAVFGHAGAVVENTIVYIDGVRTNRRRPRFTIEGSSWRGEIDPDDPTRIVWNRLPNHPGPPLYRAASGTVAGWVLFAGGTDNPYNYSGVGYNGTPSEPRPTVFGWHAASSSWVQLPALPAPSMDHRGIAVVNGLLVIVGGMGAGQEVSRTVVVAPVQDVVP